MNVNNIEKESPENMHLIFTLYPYWKHVLGLQELLFLSFHDNYIIAWNYKSYCSCRLMIIVFV
jgi:hypothetical protein